MEVNGETLFGNEWIDYEKSYAKIIVNKDGIYRVTRQELANNGISVNTISFDKLHMWNYGKEVGFLVGPNDSYIEFYAEKNKIQLDKYLYDNEDHILNRNYSFVSDDAAYFVTWTNEVNSLVFDQSEVNVIGNTITPEQFYMHKEEVISSLVDYKPTLGDQVRYSNFVSSEGYGTGLNATNTLSIPINYKSSANVDGLVYLRYGGNNVSHRTDITINGEYMGQFSAIRDSVQIFNFDVSSDLIGNDKVDITVAGTIMSNNIISDKNTISEVEVTYPREFHMGGEDSHTIFLSPSVSKRYIELDGYNGSELPIIYDMQNATRILPELLGDGKIAILVDPSNEANKLHICDPSSGLLNVKDIKLRSFISYADRTDAEFLMISSEGLRNQDNIDWVQEYADYRSSMTGGGLVTSLVDVEQLYDQFAYGVDRHFISLKNYVHWTAKNYDDPKFLFIIGKGIEYPNIRKDSSIQEATNFQVPTWGNPGSDNILMTTKDSPVPIFPIGRLAAGTSDDVRNYLDKVRDHEQNVNNPSTIEGRRWQKNVLHLSGGSSNIQDALFNSLEIMRDTIENNMFGAYVKTFKKKSTEPIEDATSELIFDEIKNGLSIITFFGHASVGAFDFNLDNVENYQNKGKYPLLMSLGCYSGNIHTTDGGISEKFVLEKDKGSIAFVAASGTAYIGVQNQFGKEFYSELGGKSFGKSMGEALVNVIETYKGFNDFGYVTFYQQLTFHGDPAVKLPSFSTADYLPDASTVNTNPKFIDTYEEDFEVCFDVLNIGKYDRDSIDILVKHENPKGEIEYEAIQRIFAPGNNINLCFTIPMSSTELVGKNRILVKVDNGEEVDEQPSPEAEANNTLRNQNGTEGHEFFILNNSAVPTFPEEFGIVNSENVSLIANTFNAFGDPQTFFVELDTTMLFDSPSLKKKEFSDIRSIIKWEIDYDLMDETVYYWRVGSDNASTGEIVWRESSFVYEPGQRAGWSQEHYFQFLRNDFENLEYVDSSRQIKFVDNVLEIRMLNGNKTGAASRVEFYKNASQWDKWRRNIDHGVTLVLFDPNTGKSTFRSSANAPLYGATSTNVSSGITFYLEYPTNTIEERTKLINVLNDSIPDGTVVALNFVAKSNQVYNIEDWAADKDILGTNIFETLENQGATKLVELQELGPLPYTFVYQKDNGKVVTEDYHTDPSVEQEVLYQIKSLWDMGSISSTMIGPSSKWDELEWDVNYSSIPENDSISIDIFGINYEGTESLIYGDLPLANFDLSNISPTDFPYLRLDFSSKDAANQTTVQLDKFRVYYTGIGDLALNTERDYKFESEKLDEGQKLVMQFRVDNISNIPLPETDLEFAIIDSENAVTTYNMNVPGLGANGSAVQTFELETRGMSGKHVLQTQLNKTKSPHEKYYFNNFSLIEFDVKKDSINPLLDVTFDGIQIMNDDIVSSNPLIRIVSDDSNPYLLLDDPSKFVVSLTAPNQEITQILVDDPAINFMAAESGDENEAVLEYNPELLEDGRYTLSVQSRDATGNASSSMNYEVDFRVYNKEMVSNVFNYPNPFSTSTQFIFTLTGNEEPGNILIRIMTLTGKVVREITAAELGNLRIGINRTEYKWDGTDEYGEKLGNGTYLYQVITKKMDGNDYDHFSDPTQNNTDHLFTKGFGKLVILR